MGNYVETKEFDLDAILSIITRCNLTDDFNKVFELVWFICDDRFINTYGLGMVYKDVKKHLITLYPELKKVKYIKGTNVEEFINDQAKIFGDTLVVTQLNQELPEMVHSKSSR